MKLCLIAFLFFPLVLSSASEKRSLWSTDYQKARDLAFESSKPMLLFFTGSDWCIWCQKLERELFSQEEFASRIEEIATPVKVDFPQRRKLPPRKRRRNDLLKAQFEVTAFPTVIYYDPSDDTILWRHSYFATNSKQYLEELSARLSPKPKAPAE